MMLENNARLRDRESILCRMEYCTGTAGDFTARSIARCKPEDLVAPISPSHIRIMNGDLPISIGVFVFEEIPNQLTGHNMKTW